MGAIFKYGEPFSNTIKTRQLKQAEYDALSIAEKCNNTFYFITDANGDEDSFQPVIYSEDEREIGVYADGKPLYQKTISLINVTLNVGNTNVDVSYLNADKIIGIIDGYAVYGTTTIALPFGLGGSYAIAMTASSNSNITIVRGGSSLATTLIQFTLRYTKTTDTPGSGTWTPQGVPALHYSTDEKVVGTWIDGSTLYERVFTGLSTQTNGTTWVHISQISTTDWNEIIDVAIYRIANNKYAKIPLAEFNGLVGGVKDLAVSIVSSSFNSTITMAIVRYTKSSS